MKLALQIAVALSAWTCLVILGYGAYRIEHEIELVERDLRRDERLVGAVVLPAVEEAMLAGGIARADAVVEGLRAREDLVQLRVVRLDPSGDTQHAPMTEGTPAELAELVADGEFVYLPDDGEPERVVSYLPIDGEPDVALELSVSLDEEHSLERATRRELGVVIALIGLCSMLLAAGIGWRLVGRKVADLIRLTRDVGAGEDPARVDPHGRDELSELARELNRMCDLLAEARRREAREAEERSALTEQLRHADRLATMGTLLARVAHDVGTPLQVIQARTQRIASGRATGEAAARNARIATEQAQRITEAIRALLDFARTGGAERAVIRPAELLREMRELLSTLARPRQVRVVVDSDVRSSTPSIQTSPQLLLQALTNLAVNAIHASPEGAEVRLSFSPPREITPPESLPIATGTFARFSVLDQGPGVDEAVASRIFQPFVTTKPAGEGTGLGLAIAQNIALELGGWIAFENLAGGGARFDVHLPTEPA